MSPLKMFFGGLIAIGLTLALVNMLFFQKPGALPIIALFGGAEPPAPTVQPLTDIEYKEFVHFMDTAQYRVIEEPPKEPFTVITLPVPQAQVFANVTAPSPAFAIGLFGLFIAWIFGPALVRRFAPLTLRRARR